MRRLSVYVALLVYTFFFAVFPGICCSTSVIYLTISPRPPVELLRTLVIVCSPNVIVALVLMLFIAPEEFGKYKKRLAAGALLSICLVVFVSQDFLLRFGGDHPSEFQELKVFEAWVTGVFLGYFALCFYPLLRKPPRQLPGG